MRILVTGGTGFLGRHVVWRAAALGAEVIFTGRNAKAAAQVLQHIHGNAHWLELAHGEPGTRLALEHAAQGVDAIVHCAALSAPWGKRADFMRANVDSTREALHAAHTAGVRRFVHISTPSVYFGFSDALNIREDAVLAAPANEYVRTKALAETLVHDHPLPETVILRPRALFGPWDQTLMPRLLRVMRQGPLPIMRDDNILLDLTYIDNAVDAIWLALTHALPSSPVTYNVSNGEPLSLHKLLASMGMAFDIPIRTRRVPWPLVNALAHGVETIARLFNSDEPTLTRYGAGVLAFSQTLNIDAIRHDLGYVPRVNIAEGLRRHAAWWHEQQVGVAA